MNFGQLKTLVWSWLDDPLGAYFTDSQVSVWLNNAQKETQKQLLQAGDNYYVTKMGGLTIQNQDTYALPTDFRFCHKFEIVMLGTTGVNEQRYTMTEVTYQQLEQVSQTTGTPACYNFRRNIVTMRPIPDNAYVIYLHQSYEVVDMVNPTDLPDIPVQYHEYLAVLATLDGFLKDQRDPTPFIAKRDAYLMLFKQDAVRRDVSAPRSIVVSDAASVGYLF